MKKILVVDDDPDMLVIVPSLLKGEYEVEICPDAAQAIKRVEKMIPDLILTDVKMPEMNGYEFFWALKNIGSPFSRIPVVVMSARENLKFMYEARATFSFLPKPFTQIELKEALLRALSK